MKDRVVELNEVGVEVVKLVGIIEFLEKEIEFEEKSIESFKAGAVKYANEGMFSMVETYKSCIFTANDRIRDLKNKVSIHKELLLFDELEYKDGNLYRYTNENHEEWLMEQIDPNMNGGVL